MKFERMNVPVFTGLKTLSSAIGTLGILDKPYYITAVRTGIPCLVANGFICDVNGVPFENQDMQEKFAWFSKKLQLMGAVAICKIDGNVNRTYRNEKELSDILKCMEGTMKSYRGKYDELKMFVEDVVIINAANIAFKARFELIKNAIKVNGESTPYVVMQETVKLEKKTEKEILDMVVENGKNGMNTYFRPEASEYMFGPIDPFKTGLFVIDPYSIINGEIKSVRKSLHKNIYDYEKELELIDFIRVEFLKSIISVPLLKIPQQQNVNILNAYESNLITKFVFRGIVRDGKVENQVSL